MQAKSPMSLRARLTWCLAVGLAALLVLAAHALPFEPGELHIQGPFVDQAGYITTARNVAELGELRCGLIYPAFVENPDWRPYMPGHYLSLAAAYALFGYGNWTSLLPNILAFVLATVGAFLLGERLYGRRAGLLAAALYAFFLGNIAYAFTAMAELTFAAACVLSLVGWLALPPRWRPVGLPFLLVLPFLFRETGALLIFPMAAFLTARAREERRWWPVLASVAAAVVCLGLINAWQVSTGKGSVPLSWVTEGDFNYTNAVREPRTLSASEWIRALYDNAARNGNVLVRTAREDFWQLRVVGLLLLLGAIGHAAWSACTRRLRDPLALGTALLGLTLLAMIFLLYDVKGHKAMRSLLFVAPLLAPIAARSLAELAARPKGPLRLGALLAAGLILQTTLVVPSARELTAQDEKVRETTEALNALGHDPRTLMLVAFDLFPFALDYAVRQYPVPWSFMPSNQPTLDLVQERFTVGTAIINAEAAGGLQRPETIHAGRLRFRRALALGRHDYVVYQKP